MEWPFSRVFFIFFRGRNFQEKPGIAAQRAIFAKFQAPKCENSEPEKKCNSTTPSHSIPPLSLDSLLECKAEKHKTSLTGPGPLSSAHSVCPGHVRTMFDHTLCVKQVRPGNVGSNLKARLRRFWSKLPRALHIPGLSVTEISDPCVPPRPCPTGCKRSTSGASRLG